MFLLINKPTDVIQTERETFVHVLLKFRLFNLNISAGGGIYQPLPTHETENYLNSWNT